MTRNELIALRNNKTVQEKIRRASDHIFEYLENEGFAIAEADFLFKELGQTLNEKQRFDPLRKLSDIRDAGCPDGYSEFFEELAEQFRTKASSYAES